MTRFGGHVAKYLGDGVMAFFGYPEAHDNDAERAVRAGLTVVEALGKLRSLERLTVRVRIDSGSVVVVGTGAGREADVFGDVPNIAARVQAVAEPGTVIIAEAMQRLVSVCSWWRNGTGGLVEFLGIEDFLHIPEQLLQRKRPRGPRLAGAYRVMAGRRTFQEGRGPDYTATIAARRPGGIVAQGQGRRWPRQSLGWTFRKRRGWRFGNYSLTQVEDRHSTWSLVQEGD